MGPSNVVQEIFEVRRWKFKVSGFQVRGSNFEIWVPCSMPPSSPPPIPTTHPLPTMPCLFCSPSFSIFSKSKHTTQISTFHFPSSTFELGTQTSILQLRTSNLQPRLQTSIFKLRKLCFEVWVPCSNAPSPPLPTPTGPHPMPPTHLPQCLVCFFFSVFLFFEVHTCNPNSKVPSSNLENGRLKSGFQVRSSKIEL